MKILICFLIGVFCDNIEIGSADFDELIVHNEVIRSKEMFNSNSVKLSFLGSSIYKLREIKPRIFEIYDSTVYFGNAEPSKIRIDFEFKIIGVADFVIPFILFSVCVTFISSYIIQRTLKRVTRARPIKNIKKID